ncbi:MAG TPA: DoxX family membrane protein [Candidatus Paceibacterota bacterium]|nr:DoxX family membrane protein [Candidatus Paceibacterota bacterium]
MRSLLTRIGILLTVSAVPVITSAHEVYVLTPAEIKYGLQTPSFNELATIGSYFFQFTFWGLIAVVTIVVVFFISIIRPLERLLDPVLTRARRYAEPVARITIGLSFIAAAYYGATYGPELPILATFGAATFAIRLILVGIGVMLIANVYSEIAALIALALFIFSVYAHGMYMLTYANYFGDILLILVLGTWSSRHLFSKKLAPYAFPFLRVCFGISLFYASLYAKILHNTLALQVASLPLAGHATSISHVFGFDPHFLVLGAAIIEILIALFFILGIEIRFTALFLLFWLSLSLWYFGEVVWPHLILIGIPIAFMLYGYDTYSLEGRFFKRRDREPVF